MVGLLAAALVASASATVVLAAETTSAQDIAAHLFSKVDADGDGFISAEEYDKSGMSRFGGSFAALDADVDGAVSEREYIDAFARSHAPGEDA